jgi:carbonic anhydrase/acetyltransferase-like protein (isoleucine patch superfamily)
MSEKPRILKSPVNGAMPKIHPSVFIAPSATIIGDVEIGENTNIWFNVVIRAEAGKIKIGKNCSIQENIMIHTEPGTELKLADNILAGHCCVIHGPGEIGSNVMIGISATVLQGHKIEDNVLIAAGAVARGHYESMAMYAGKVQAEKIKDIKKSDVRQLQTGLTFYVENGRKFKAMFKESNE